jgi:hypothetical protein
VSATVYVLSINQETLFIDKFKKELNNIPQSIDQNIKEDTIYKMMGEYVQECQSNGTFLFYRIEIKQNVIDLQIKYAVQYDNLESKSKDIIQHNLKLQRYLTRKNKASKDLNELLISITEGSIYVLDRQDIASSIKPFLEPLASSFSLINKGYLRFRYIPIFHKKLGLIILLGYLEAQSDTNTCTTHDIEFMLDKLYGIYKN